MEVRNVNFHKSRTEHYHIVGRIYGDARGVFKDGTAIYSSRIIEMDVVGADLIIKTKNSTYTLKDYKEDLGIEDLEVVKEFI